MIQAVLYHDQYYVGGSKRVTQIAGRLLGTAKGSQEKERATARMIQSDYRPISKASRYCAFSKRYEYREIVHSASGNPWSLH